MTYCRYCGERIEKYDFGWIETRSGDDGGYYDFCPDSEDEIHRPERKAVLA